MAISSHSYENLHMRFGRFWPPVGQNVNWLRITMNRVEIQKEVYVLDKSDRSKLYVHFRYQTNRHTKTKCQSKTGKSLKVILTRPYFTACIYIL